MHIKYSQNKEDGDKHCSGGGMNSRQMKEGMRC